MALRPLDQAVLYTLAYTTQFHYPLTPAELSDRLIFKLSESQVLLAKASRSEIAQTISKLLKRRLLIKQGSYLTLPGFEFTANTRDQRQAYAAARQPELTEFVALSQACPWVEAVFVTGSLAMGNADKDDDVDFMIVTQPGRLWLTRLWLLWQAMRRGKRRSFQGEEKGSWCFNLWLESQHLGIFAEQASLYTAYELLQAQPLWDRAGIAPALIEENYWAKSYISRAAKWQAARQLRAKRSRLVTAPQGFLSVLNRVAYALQLLYMKPHMTREKVALGYAFFHPRDTQDWIYRGWTQIIQKITI